MNIEEWQKTSSEVLEAGQMDITWSHVMRPNISKHANHAIVVRKNVNNEHCGSLPVQRVLDARIRECQRNYTSHLLRCHRVDRDDFHVGCIGGVGEMTQRMLPYPNACDKQHKGELSNREPIWEPLIA